MKRRGTKQLEQLKSLIFKIQESTSKSVAITEKKGKNMLDKSYTSTRGIYLQKLQMIYINQGHLPTKVTNDIHQPGAFTYKSYLLTPIKIYTTRHKWWNFGF